MATYNSQECSNDTDCRGAFGGNFTAPEETLTSPSLPQNYPNDTDYYGACGGNFTDPKGILTSPSFPQNYPNDEDCTYIISQPNDTIINMTIEDMDLEFDDSFGFGINCYDYLEIRDGKSEESELIGQFCGNNTFNNLNETSIISRQNQVWMR